MRTTAAMDGVTATEMNGMTAPQRQQWQRQWMAEWQ